MMYAQLTLTDKVPMAALFDGAKTADSLAMTAIVLGGDDELDRAPAVYGVSNVNSPLRYDVAMLDVMESLALRNQVTVVTPFLLMGAMAPVAIPSALVQQTAEQLAGVAYAQLVRPGAPVIYGGFTSNVDMQSGAPAFGTPEYMRTAMVGGQLARRYRVPYRSSNVWPSCTNRSRSARVPSRRSSPSSTNGAPATPPNTIWSPPKTRSRSGVRPRTGNSPGAFATCSSRKSGSNRTTPSSPTSWPAARNRAWARSQSNRIPISDTSRRHPPSRVAIASSESTS